MGPLDDHIFPSRVYINRCWFIWFQHTAKNYYSRRFSQSWLLSSISKLKIILIIFYFRSDSSYDVTSENYYMNAVVMEVKPTSETHKFGVISFILWTTNKKMFGERNTTSFTTILETWHWNIIWGVLAQWWNKEISSKPNKYHIRFVIQKSFPFDHFNNLWLMKIIWIKLHRVIIQ